MTVVHATAVDHRNDLDNLGSDHEGRDDSDLNVRIPPLSSLPTNPRILADVNFQRYLDTNPMRPPHYSAGSRLTPVRELPRFEEWNQTSAEETSANFNESSSAEQANSVAASTYSLRYLKWLQGNLRNYGSYVIEDGSDGEGNSISSTGIDRRIRASRNSTGISDVIGAIDRLRDDYREWRAKSPKDRIDGSQEGMNLVPFYPELFVFPKAEASEGAEDPEVEAASSDSSDSSASDSSAAHLPQIAGLGVKIGPMFGSSESGTATGTATGSVSRVSSVSTPGAPSDKSTSNHIQQIQVIQHSRSGIFQLADATERHLEAILKGTSTLKLSLTGSGGWESRDPVDPVDPHGSITAISESKIDINADGPKNRNREAMWISFRTRGIGALRNTYLDHWHTDFDVNRCKKQMGKQNNDGDLQVPCNSITSNQGEEVLEEFVLTWLPFLCTRLRNYKVEYDCDTHKTDEKSSETDVKSNETDVKADEKDSQMRTLRSLVSSAAFPDEHTVMRIGDLVQEARNDPARCDGEPASDSDEIRIDGEVSQVSREPGSDCDSSLSSLSDDSFRRLRDRLFQNKSQEMRALLEKHDQDVINIWFTLHTNPADDLDNTPIPEHKPGFFYPGSGCLLQSSEVFADRKKDLRLLDQFIVEEHGSGNSGPGGFGGGGPGGFGGGPAGFGPQLMDAETLAKISNPNYGVPEVRDTDLIGAFSDCMRQKRKGGKADTHENDETDTDETDTHENDETQISGEVTEVGSPRHHSYLKSEEIAFMFRSQRCTHRSCQYVYRGGKRVEGEDDVQPDSPQNAGPSSHSEASENAPPKVKRNNMEARFLVLNEGGLCEFARWIIDLARKCEELVKLKESWRRKHCGTEDCEKLVKLKEGCKRKDFGTEDDGKKTIDSDSEPPGCGLAAASRQGGA